MMTADSNSSILRGVRILVGLAELGKPVSFGVLASELGLPSSSVHRILSTLRDAGYVTQNLETASYAPSSRFLQAATVFSAASTYPKVVRDVVEELVASSGETAYYGSYHMETGRYRFLRVLYSEHAIQYMVRTDKSYSVLWGASGRSIAAYLPVERLQKLFQIEGSRSTFEGNEPLPDWEAFLGIMAEIRGRGYCSTTNQRFEGAHSTAASIFGANGAPIGSVGISLPASRRDITRIEKFGVLVRAAAERLTIVAQCNFSPDWGGQMS